MRTEATKLVETLAAERCPCGHLKQRHRKPTRDGEQMGECRDCECQGLFDWSQTQEDE